MADVTRKMLEQAIDTCPVDALVTKQHAEEMVNHLATALGLDETENRQSVPEFASADEAMGAQTKEPVGWRIMRAFLNGYEAGLKRGLEGPLDHNR